MATTKKYISAVDRMDRMAVSEKVSTAKLEEIFTDLDPDQIREWIDALEDFASTYDEARDAFGEWQDAEGREEKADARDRLLTALEQTSNNSIIFTDLPEIPELGLTPTPEGVDPEA